MGVSKFPEISNPIEKLLGGAINAGHRTQIGG